MFEIRSYYESSDLPSAIGVMEEALSRHPELVTPECVNMAAELYIANHQYSKALEVRTCFDLLDCLNQGPCFYKCLSCLGLD